MLTYTLEALGVEVLVVEADGLATAALLTLATLDFTWKDKQQQHEKLTKINGILR